MARIGETGDPWFRRSLNKLLTPRGVKIVDVTLLNSLVLGDRWKHLVLYFSRLFSLVKDVPGDIVECGVASGDSLTILSILARNGDVKRHVWGFDSFQGLPAPSEEDLSSPESAAREGMFCESNEGKVLSHLRLSGLDDHAIKDQVTLVKGFFAETLPKSSISSVAFLNIDADLYNSCKVCLENLWPKVSLGGIVAFDEYESQEWPGEKKAVDEYFSTKMGEVEMHRDPSIGKYYAVKLR